MLNSISWKEFFFVISVLLVCYYAVIAYRYYQKEILQVLGITIIEPGVIPAAAMRQFTDGNKNEDDTGYLPQPNNDGSMQSLKDELNAYFEAIGQPAVKEEILFGLKNLLTKYPNLQHQQFRSSINQIILSASNLNSISNLDEGELEDLWKQVV
jgi:hypothetical protein